MPYNRRSIVSVKKQELHLGGKHLIRFVPETDLVFRMSESPFHPNALVAEAAMADGREVSATYYSVGGGFVVTEGETEHGNSGKAAFRVSGQQREGSTGVL